jgi:protein-arginine kinase
MIISSRLDLTSSLQKSKSHFISSEEIKKNKEFTVEYGIEIDDDVWREINTIDFSVMVESTERSRKYAGGN